MKDNYIETMTAMEPFVRYQRGPGGEYQKKAQRLCWQFNQSDPDNMGQSVVTRDIPAGVVAAGVPCKVIRPLTENDVIPEAKITNNTRATNEY